MNLHHAPQIVLLTRAPRAHTGLVRSLEHRGMRVDLATRPRSAITLLCAAPLLVLVDLVHGAGLDRSVVRRLNAMGGATTVLGLHSGRLDSCPREVQELTVGGFCRADDWGLLVLLMGPAPAGGAAATVH